VFINACLQILLNWIQQDENLSKFFRWRSFFLSAKSWFSKKSFEFGAKILFEIYPRCVLD